MKSPALFCPFVMGEDCVYAAYLVVCYTALVITSHLSFQLAESSEVYWKRKNQKTLIAVRPILVMSSKLSTLSDVSYTTAASRHAPGYTSTYRCTYRKTSVHDEYEHSSES